MFQPYNHSLRRIRRFVGCLLLSLSFAGAYSQEADLQARLAAEQAALSQLRINFVQTVAEQNDQIVALETELADLKASTATPAADAAQARLLAEQQALSQLRIQFVQTAAELNDTITAQAAQIADLTTELDTVKTSAAEPVAAANSQDTAAMTTLSQRLADEQAALAALRIRFVQEIAAREEQLSSLESQQIASSATEAQLSETRTALSDLRVELVQAVALREDRIADLESQVAAQETSTLTVNEASAHNDALTLANETLARRLADEQAALAQLKVRFVQELSAAQAASSTDSGQAELEAQIASLKQQLRETQDQLATLTAENSATNGSASSTATQATYTVLPGDSLSKLALEFLGDSSLWETLANANGIPLENADVLEPGTVLVIPKP